MLLWPYEKVQPLQRLKMQQSEILNAAAAVDQRVHENASASRDRDRDRTGIRVDRGLAPAVGCDLERRAGHRQNVLSIVGADLPGCRGAELARLEIPIGNGRGLDNDLDTDQKAVEANVDVSEIICRSGRRSEKLASNSFDHSFP